MTFKNRKRNRLEGFDYSSSGAYFLTVCVSDMRSVLGRVIVGDGVLDVPEMRLSELKRLVGRQLGVSLFQRSYHDHIIRDGHEYDMIWRYIDENPLRWKQDCFCNE